MVDIRTLDDQASLQDLILRQPLQPFLQSWAWGEFQRALGRPIWRLGAFVGDELVGSALVIQHELLLGKTYVYCPRGPLALTEEAWTALTAAITDLGRQQKAMYVKVDPTILPFGSPLWEKSWTAGTALQPPKTVLINLGQSEEDLLAKMHSKTRYNIRLAERHEVHVSWSTDDAELEIFLTLLFRTYERQGIRAHSKGYYEKLFHTLRQAQMVSIVTARYQGQPLASNMIIWHGKTVTYLHGGSADDGKEHMAPHVLQWQTMLEAKHRGCLQYDLWGLSSTKVGRVDRGGVARFKQGFGGEELDFPEPKNLILDQSWYWAYRLAKRFRGFTD